MISPADCIARHLNQVATALGRGDEITVRADPLPAAVITALEGEGYVVIPAADLRHDMPDKALAAANLVTVADISVRTGLAPDVAEGWTRHSEWPRPIIPACAGAAVWWWPDVMAFVVAHGNLRRRISMAAALEHDMVPPARRPGRPPTLTPELVHMARAMRGQVDDGGRPRYTLAQISAAMPVTVTVATIRAYAPADAG